MGPTHFYGGLAFGNRASMEHSNVRSNPKAAALQGLEKMKLMMDLGAKQAVLPPHPRPFWPLLHRLGYKKIEEVDDQLLAIACSSASMWTANSATITPSFDNTDGKLHITPANMASQPHRAIEANYNYRLFKEIFPFAEVHRPLPPFLGDEGAANHIRLNSAHLFVYGRELYQKKSGHFPARQVKEASEAIIRNHKVSAILAKQSQKAIDAGVFHNDVIAMGCGNLLIYHEDAYEKPPSLDCETVVVTNKQLPLEIAVKSYLFNSQILERDGKRILIAPLECEKLDLSFLPFDETFFVDLSQSMQNGGGPACLRLRVQLTAEEKRSIHKPILLTQKLYEELKQICSHYPDSLTLQNLRQPQLLTEVEKLHLSVMAALQLQTAGPAYGDTD
ncbi:MAG: N-succinylarginine dihydrolase [Chlamydiae bacterium]|nr:N-succinylarginine dihydrolase [Chlamydiota bacterium]